MSIIKPIESWWLFPGFELEHLATGLHKPTNVVVVQKPGQDDDPLAYVVELYGKIKVITNGGKVREYATGLLNYSPDYVFPGSGESGLGGICLEPRSGDLFVSMIYQEGDGFKAKVVRMVSGNGLEVDTVETIIEGIPSVRGAHQIQAVTIGPDEKLYVNVGDGMLDPSPAQDEGDLRGKVLRIEMDGSIPSDNPWGDSPVFAKGFRNPFGAAWRKSDRKLFISDNGPRSNDRIAMVEAGGDYGWQPDMTKNSLFRWTFTQAPTALDFMQDGQFQDRYRENLFVALPGTARYLGPSLKGKRIVKLGLNEDTTGLRSYDDFVIYIGEGRAMPVGLSFGPGGLYFTDFHGEGDIYGSNPEGNLFRVRGSGEEWRWSE